MSTNSRERMIASAIALLQRRGLAGTSFREVIADSGAPRGSIYHHFPGGKHQLALEAIGEAGAFGAALISDAAESGDPRATMRAFLGTYRSVLESSDFTAGCPVLAVAVEAGAEDSELRDAAGDAFDGWRRALATGLRSRGVASRRAASLATTVVAAVEGAVVLCRVLRSVEPLRQVGAELDRMLGSALDD